ncbi:hypothetical protein EV128_125108 [Rhizobium azibense]|nr:hypothetical protein EV128_125108 [Rhizobium azibense]
MNRRVFDNTLTLLKASLLETATKLLEEQGMTFDIAGYQAQASFDLDDVAREMLFFGAKLYPAPTPTLVLGSLEIAA